MVAAQRVALQLPPRRAAKTVKIVTISRAEGGQLQAPVRPQPTSAFLLPHNRYGKQYGIGNEYQRQEDHKVLVILQ